MNREEKAAYNRKWVKELIDKYPFMHDQEVANIIETTKERVMQIRREWGIPNVKERTAKLIKEEDLPKKLAY
jgi:hypothetical protein